MTNEYKGELMKESLLNLLNGNEKSVTIVDIYFRGGRKRDD